MIAAITRQSVENTDSLIGAGDSATSVGGVGVELGRGALGAGVIGIDDPCAVVDVIGGMSRVKVDCPVIGWPSPDTTRYAIV